MRYESPYNLGGRLDLEPADRIAETWLLDLFNATIQVSTKSNTQTKRRITQLSLYRTNQVIF